MPAVDLALSMKEDKESCSQARIRSKCAKDKRKRAERTAGDRETQEHGRIVLTHSSFRSKIKRRRMQARRGWEGKHPGLEGHQWSQGACTG